MRVGIWGISSITHFHIEALKKIDHIELIGFGGRFPQSGSNLVKKYNLSLFDKLDNLLAQKLDVLVITSSVDQHWNCIHYAYKYVKHIICEKPLFFNRHEYLEFQKNISIFKTLKLDVVGQKVFNADFLDFKKKIKYKDAISFVGLNWSKSRPLSTTKSANHQIQYAQLPHALDYIFEFAQQPLNISSLHVENVIRDDQPDYLSLHLTHPQFLGVINIESFHTSNQSPILKVCSKDLQWVYNPNKVQKSFMFKIKNKSKHITTVNEFINMYQTLLTKQNNTLEQTLAKAEILTLIVEKLNAKSI